MRDRLKLLCYFILYWLGFMVMIRIIFLAYNHDLSSNLTPLETIQVFLYGLKMDASMSGYAVMFTSLLLSISIFTTSNIIKKVIDYFTILFLFLGSVITIIDIELYRHWGFRLNTTPLFYIGPEALGSIEIGVIVKTLCTLLVLFPFFLLIYLRLISPQILKLKTKEWKVFGLMIFVTALFFIPIRGSFTVAPMNTGFVYFHNTKAYANHAAINVIWNFYKSLGKRQVIYPENFFNKTRSQSIFNNLYPKSDSTIKLLKTPRPNIIIIILESFTTNVIASLGGMNNITPNLNTLCKQGILFDNFYASGDRTDKGIVSILSGYPAQPQSSIIKEPSKAQHLSYLPRKIKALEYHTSFLYGGDVDFANFRSYLTNCRFDHITSMDDFPDEWNTSKWGIHDHHVFNQGFVECDSAKQPFMKVMLTLSSHEPFDVPMPTQIKGTDQESLFLNACYYTDKSLGDFIHKAQKESWWSNTLIIITADHGHRLPGNLELKNKERFHIPMLWLGGAIIKDTVIHTYANQTDIANTLLGQVDVAQDEFRFSKNILGNNTKSFAAYFFDNGYGFVKPGKFVSYDNPGMQFLDKVGSSQEDLDTTKAYQQILYIDFNKK